MELENDIKTYSYFLIDMDPDKLTKIQNAMQLAKGKTLPGQVIVIPIAPGIAFRYAPDKPPAEKRGGVLGAPAPAADQVTKAYLDRQ